MIIKHGRWCECGGLLAYKRALSGDPLGQTITTFIWCWSCGERVPVHTEPCSLPEPAETELREALDCFEQVKR